MANQRKSKERKDWSAVVERLSSAPKRKPSEKAVRTGHTNSMESRQSGRVGRMGSVGEQLLEVFLRAERLTGWEREYKFHPIRKWRFDFAFPGKMIAVEVEGAIWANGRHNRGAGFIEDCRKYNEAVILGWRVIRVTTDMVRSGEAMKYINEAI